MESSFRPTLWLILGRASGFIASFLVPIVLARVFGQVEFGTYRQIFLIYGTLYLIAQLGMAESLYYFLPLAPSKSGRYALNSLVFLATAGLMCVALLRALGPDIGRWLSNQQLADYIALLGVYLLLMLGSAGLEITMIARKRYRDAAVCYALSDGVRTLCLIVPVLLGRKLEGLMLGAVGFASLRFAAQFLYLKREFRDQLHLDWALLRDQMVYALPFGLGVVFGILQVNFHQYAVSHYFTTAIFAVYAVGTFQIPLVDLVASSAGSVMMVRMTEKVRGQDEAVLAIWHSTISKLALVLFPVVGWALVVAPELVTVLFSNTYRASVPIFMIWSTAILFSVLQTDGVIRVYAKIPFALFLSVFRFLLILASIGWFLSVFHLYGAALATLVVLLVDKVLALARIRGLMRVGVSKLLPWRRLMGASGAAAAAAVGTLLLKAQLALPAFLTLSIASVLYAGCYLALVNWLDVMDSDEKLTVSRWLKRVTEAASKRHLTQGQGD